MAWMMEPQFDQNLIPLECRIDAVGALGEGARPRRRQAPFSRRRRTIFRPSWCDVRRETNGCDVETSQADRPSAPGIAWSRVGTPVMA